MKNSANFDALLAKAEQGDIQAQYNLGMMYWYGNGVAVDKREAVLWYHKAAEQKHAAAQSFLGWAYMTGAGVTADKHEAVRWYRKSAKQGHAQAQFNLGLAYSNGQGVAEDKHQAVHWHRKAAYQGHAWAQYSLGLAYQYGAGATMRAREACVWFSVAKESGNETAAAALHQRIKDLSPSKIRSIQKGVARRLEMINCQIAESKKELTGGKYVAATAATDPKLNNASVATQVFDKTWVSVVFVKNGSRQGSGVIIRQNIVATNYHVVNSDADIFVYQSINRRTDTKTALPATIRHADKDRDFCLLNVGGLWGVSATVRKYDTLSIGEDVYSLGAPKGYDLSFSDGIISQLRKTGSVRHIQTNAVISPGSSGGGLFDSDGNLIGITTSRITDGIGFAIPADLILEL